MPSYDNIEQSFLQQIHASDLSSDECAKLLKNLTALNSNRPEDVTTTVETSEKTWLDKNSGELIKGGAAIVSVLAILIFEKGLHGIITSKATTFVPR